LFTPSAQRQKPTLHRNIGLRRGGVPKDTAASVVPARDNLINIPLSPFGI